MLIHQALKLASTCIFQLNTATYPTYGILSTATNLEYIIAYLRTSLFRCFILLLLHLFAALIYCCRITFVSSDPTTYAVWVERVPSDRIYDQRLMNAQPVQCPSNSSCFHLGNNVIVALLCIRSTTKSNTTTIFVDG